MKYDWHNSIVELLTAGTLSGVGPGSPRTEVIRGFGEPEDLGTLKRFELFAYGGRALQVTLDEGTVYLVGLYVDYADGAAHFFSGNPSLTKASTHHDVSERLRAWRVPFRQSALFPSALATGHAHVNFDAAPQRLRTFRA